ncbi:MAG: tetratricopeptide repeat protein [Bacteroidetes bacterium]|nr:tetratricopeptide repeat protein [Bacteroidota bacterium]
MNNFTLLLIAILNFLFCFKPNDVFSQDTRKIDSLLEVLETGEPDSNRAAVLNIVAAEYANYDYSKAMDFGNRALELAEKLNIKEEIGTACNNIGSINIYQGKYAEALDYLIRALRIWEERNDKKSMAKTMNNIGNVYYYLRQFPDAIKWYQKKLDIEKQTGNHMGIAQGLYNIGLIYMEQEQDFDKAFINFNLSLQIMEQIGSAREIAYLLNSLGSVKESQEKFDESLDWYNKSLEKFREANDKKGIAATLASMGLVYFKSNSFPQAIEYLNNGLATADEIGTRDISMQVYQALGEVYFRQKQYKKSIEYYQKYTHLKDSLLNEKSSQMVAEMQTKYETEKKDKELIIKNAEITRQQSENRQKSLERNAFIIAFFMVALLAFFIFRGYMQKRKSNRVLAEKNKIIEEKNIEITDSITYARRIQQAVLPVKSEIDNALSEYFILFKPKDIVSGDFYYFSKNDAKNYIAAADCTGHGVPGAFMCMIGSEKLKEAVREKENPGDILSFLNKGIKSSLRQSGSQDSTRDGMDIALVRIVETQCTVSLQYAGANRPLWIIRKNKPEIEEIRPTKKAIGGFTEDDQVFETHEVLLVQGDTFYIFSDGYVDQDGGKAGKKLMTKHFRQLLLEIQDKTMPEQEKFLDDYFENWRGGKTQLDDILVIGVRI